MDSVCRLRRIRPLKEITANDAFESEVNLEMECSLRIISVCRIQNE